MVEAASQSLSRAGVRALLALALAALVAAFAAAPVRAAEIVSAGPLTRISLAPDLACQVAQGGDATFEFFPPSASPGDCGTFVVVNGTLYAPNFAAQPGSSTAGIGPYVAFTPVSQSLVTGSGGQFDPYRVETRVRAGDSGVEIVQIDTYAVGRDSYTTEIRVLNGPARSSVVVYRAGRCHFQDRPRSYGFVDPDRRAVGCSTTPNNAPPGGIQAWVPIAPSTVPSSSGASYLEGSYTDVWAAIASHQAFANLCRCPELLESAAGLSWQESLAPGARTAYAHDTVFVPAPPAPPVADRDLDTVPDAIDNCPDLPNVDQADVDDDDIGDACDDSNGALAPIAGRRVVLRVISGKIYIRYPSGQGPTPFARPARIRKGRQRGFVALRGASSVPVKSVVDAEEGRVEVTSAADLLRRTQRAQVRSGVFQITQPRSARPTTTFRLRAASLRTCPRPRARSSDTAQSAQRRSRRRLGRLFTNGRGRFRTRGRFAAATVRGTIWLTEDRCDGTLTRNVKGTIAVFDFVKGRRVTLTRGRSYLARATVAAIRRRARAESR